MEQHQALRETFRHYVNGQLNETEAKAFLAHVQSGQDRALLKELIEETFGSPLHQDQLVDPGLRTILDESWANLHNRIAQSPAKSNIRWGWIIGIAATMLCVLTVGIGLYIREDTKTTNQVGAVVPGTQSATLTLVDGRKIRLSETDNGQLAEDAGVRISKSADGQLVYEVLEDQPIAAGYNTLSTAKGETYKVKLPDGTQVWLNAASSIRYATNFSVYGTRRVTLDGEAYFDVAKNAERPFVVRSGDQDVEVLGTRFNINSYTDEADVLTTLLEGSIQVKFQKEIKTLRPGQQSNLSSSGNLRVREVDTDPVISWINNEFMFDGDNIETVMRKIARWYNVDVVYQGAMTTEKFGGGLSRFESVEEVLQLLEKTGAVKFRIENRIIYVQSNG
ncbi:DUF4974 domain-containing protein [Sphingobacterium phlebotomi]|uniref:DUF4974 domain-containing protein n=1 Tax=Sphingobacterium phlebotomi TaxID=2605433 RepID=A0A5D4HA12_9SPHI|nr:FecR family protein [Sphingobacterium phlebotomi]TYR37478.1 DUF4974 domain-containing protein [Sphingobacterium phlebotomi]